MNIAWNPLTWHKDDLGDVRPFWPEARSAASQIDFFALIQ